MSPNRHGHILPSILDSEKVILDIGCGIGQTLLAVEPKNKDLVIGVDINSEALEYGNDLNSDAVFARCNSESLPFPDNSFDLIISRVTLPYTHIPTSLAEINRILKPGGRIWFTMHSKNKTFQQLFDSIKRFKISEVVFRLYVLSNGLLFHTTGGLYRFPLSGQFESFQTKRSMKRSLERNGFKSIDIEHDVHFKIQASK